ncbi:MAG: response regulator [Thaumarchaeota archaeon]|nr:response regulator [Nitrososphaerota archaeon]
MTFDILDSENRRSTRIRAIVVEDDIELRELFVELLRAYSIEVIGTGSNGKEAVDLYQIHHPEIVFMDLNMPLYDGYYGIGKIKEYEKDAKIIVLSGPVEDPLVFGMYNGIEFLEKPIDMKKIGNAINKLIGDAIKAQMR